jgi:membrane-associated protein
MEFISDLVSFVLHIDRHLAGLLESFGPWTYVLLFAIVFAETGLVFTPFLPGDSLLFAAGALSALGPPLDPVLLTVLLSIAAIAGDSLNYKIGRIIGPRVFSGRVRFVNPRHLERTRRFFERHGDKTIVIARFVPIVRTFAPFLAGVGEMHYPRFLAWNVIGGVVWVTLFTLAGYFFGNLPLVRDNFGLVVLGIIALSVVPVVTELLRHRRKDDDLPPDQPHRTVAGEGLEEGH